jgi:hypothetical protein
MQSSPSTKQLKYFAFVLSMLYKNNIKLVKPFPKLVFISPDIRPAINSAVRFLNLQTFLPLRTLFIKDKNAGPVGRF